MVISHNRSGGTFLSHCLNSHPLIHCTADEVLHRNNAYVRSGLSNVQIMTIVLGFKQYEVSMCKLSYSQFLVYDKVRNWLVGREAKIIHLARGNWLASAISEMVRHKQNHPTHSFYARPDGGTVELDVDKVWTIAWRMKHDGRKARKLISEMESENISLNYTDIVGGEGIETDHIVSPAKETICDFLGVPHEPLEAPYMRKCTNNIPDLVSNWDEIKERMKDTKFDGFMRQIDEANN